MHAFSILDRAIEFTKFKLYTRDQFHVRASLASWEITLAIPCPCISFFFFLSSSSSFSLHPFVLPPQSYHPCSNNTPSHFALVSDRPITIRYLNVWFVVARNSALRYILEVDTEQLAMGSPSRSR